MTAPATNDWFTLGERVLRDLARQWRFTLGAMLLGATAGGVTAVLLPSYFRSSAAFQAESAPTPQISGALAGLASQIGGLNLASQNNAQFFGDLLTTDAVLRRVALANYPWQGEMAPLPSIYGFGNESPPLRDYHTASKLRGAMSLDVNTRTGVVRFSIEARTPQVAQALAETTLDVLNQANIHLRQARAAAERQFTADRATQARLELESAEETLALFYQRNRMIANSPSLQMAEAKLKRTVDMAQQVYVQLRMQEEQAALQEVRNTPAVSIIDPPLAPVKRARPNRRLAVALGLLIGVMVAVGRLLLLRTNPRPVGG